MTGDPTPPAGSTDPRPVAEERPADPPLQRVHDEAPEAPGEGADPTDREPEEVPRVGVEGMGPTVEERAREVVTAPATPGEPLSEADVERIFNRSVGLFNQSRYWHAHEGWEILWRQASGEERDFYQGLIQIAAGLLHLQRRNRRGATNKLSEGIEKLVRFQPKYRGIVVDDLVTRAASILDEMQDGEMPYLVPPVLKSAP